jgi:hypothetical protein
MVAYWRARSEEWERLQVLVNGQAVCQEFLTQLEQLWAMEDAAEVSLREAATLTGYSEDHLRRLVRQQKLEVQWRGSRLFFRATDLPRKRSKIASSSPVEYDPKADARRVAARRNGEDTHGTQAAA